MIDSYHSSLAPINSANSLSNASSSSNSLFSSSNVGNGALSSSSSSTGAGAIAVAASSNNIMNSNGMHSEFKEFFYVCLLVLSIFKTYHFITCL